MEMERMRQTHSKEIENRDEEVEEARQSCQKKVNQLALTHPVETLVPPSLLCSKNFSRCKLLYIGWINTKVLPYSTGSYIHYPVIKHNGEEHFLKKNVSMYITKSLCRTAEIGTTLQINYISFKKQI